jgi:hypothetical protein
VPKFEFELGQVAACCGSVVTVEIRDGDIHARCSCHRVEIEGWAVNPNGPSLRSVCDHTCQRRIRLSGRIVQGLILREVFKTARGRIFQSRGGMTYMVSVDAEDGRQIWFDSFAGAYCELVGRPWEGET